MKQPCINASQLRALGAQLAVHLVDVRGLQAPAAVRQALVADLFAGFNDLLIPLKDVVRRPGFECFYDKGSAQRGVIQRDALLRDLQQIYAPAVLAQVAEVLNGFLGLAPDGSISAAWNDVTFQQIVEEPVPAFAPPVTQPQHVNAQRQGAGSPMGLLLTLLAVGALSVLAVIALRNPELCRLTGSCVADPAATHGGSRLQPALAAVDALQKSETLASYEQALSLLQRELLRLSSAELGLSEQQQLKVLKGQALQGRRRLAALQADDLSLGLKRQRGEPTPEEAIPQDAPSENPTPPRRAKPTESDPPSVPEPAPAPVQRDPPALIDPPPAPAASSSNEYSLPRAWEERRERRRQIMQNYR